MDLNPNLDLSSTTYHKWLLRQQKAHEELMKECCNWDKAVSSSGYGVTWKHNKTANVHKVVYEECFEEVPKGYVVMHTCDNPRCINPSHLKLGTYWDNTHDMVSKGRHAFGSRVGTSILTEDLVKLIKSMSGSSSQLAKFFNVSKTTIKDIKKNKIWKHV